MNEKTMTMNEETMTMNEKTMTMDDGRRDENDDEGDYLSGFCCFTRPELSL